MIALVLIWLFAALCGLLAAWTWDLILAGITAFGAASDPAMHDLAREIVAWSANADAAVGWVVALAVGVPLTLLWLGARLVLRALRGPVPARGPVAMDRPASVPPGERRSSGSASSAPSPEPRPAPKAPPPPVADVPRWGRQ